MSATTQRRILTPTWHPATVTAGDARTLRAEDTEEALQRPRAARAHVALAAPYVPVKRLSFGYRVARAIARAVTLTLIAGLIVVGLWGVIVVLGA